MAIRITRFISTIIFLLSSCVVSSAEIIVMIGDNDGYGYGHSQVLDNGMLPTNPNPPLSGPCEGWDWIFDNREEELGASDGSQHTDQEPCSGDSFDFTIPFTPVPSDAFSSADFILDVSGL